MDNSTLVALDVDAGGRIVSALEASRIEPTVALWMRSPEYEEGRLVLASKSLDQQHPLKAYEKVAQVLNEKSIAADPPVLILRLKDPFISALRKLFAKASSVAGMRLGGQTFGNRFISDGYIYRIK